MHCCTHVHPTLSIIICLCQFKYFWTGASTWARTCFGSSYASVSCLLGWVLSLQDEEFLRSRSAILCALWTSPGRDGSTCGWAVNRTVARPSQQWNLLFDRQRQGYVGLSASHWQQEVPFPSETFPPTTATSACCTAIAKTVVIQWSLTSTWKRLRWNLPLVLERILQKDVN